MRLVATWMGAFFLVALCCAPGAAATVASSTDPVHASLDRDMVELGRPFVYRMSLSHAPGKRVNWPAANGFGPAFEEVSRRVSERAERAGLVTSELQVELMLFDTAVQEVPSLLVTLEGAPAPLQSPALALGVKELVDLESPQLRPLAAPVDVPVRDTRLLVMLGVVPLALLLIAFAYWGWRRRDVSPARLARRTPPRLPPYQEALQRLLALESSGLLEQGDLKPAYLNMSEIVREYLGRRFEFSSLDLTTSEIRLRLLAVDEGKAEWIGPVMTWLSRCDLVKYARSAADRGDASEALGLARDWIEQTRQEESTDLEAANA